MTRRAVVTGGAGFIGSVLVRRLVEDSWDVVVVDTLLRGDESRLRHVLDSITLHHCDIRDEDDIADVVAGADVVFHLAAINGTENFYQRPELVLDVGLRGALAVVNACRRSSVPDLVVASSAEVYQTPQILPTPESAALSIPDVTNPRYSYGGSKIATELIALNYARDHFRKLQIFRPHNVYGPDMGWKHVIPQFAVRASRARVDGSGGKVPFAVQGDGTETRAFCFVSDVVDGIIMMYERGEHRTIYHIGNDQEVSVNDLVGLVGDVLGLDLQSETTPAVAGGTSRRCPDIARMRAIGYEPRVTLLDGLRTTVDWYVRHPEPSTANELL